MGRTKGLMKMHRCFHLRGPLTSPGTSTGGLLLAIVGSWILAAPTGACDWDLPPQSREISLPVKAWHVAPPGKTLIGISYTVSKSGGLMFTRTVESHYGRLGVRVAPISEETASSLGLEPRHGVRITEVVSNSAAENEGLREGDIILKVLNEGEKNGIPIIGEEMLPSIVRSHDLEKQLLLEIYRNHDVQYVSVHLDRHTKQEVLYETIPLPLTRDNLHSGATYGELTKSANQYLFGNEETQGVMIVDIRGGTPLFYSEVRRGDIITAIDGQSVDHPSVVIENLALMASSGKKVVFTVRRGHILFQDSFKPERDLSRGFSIDIPVVIRWKISPARTDFDLGWGLVLDYDRRARVTSSGEHRESKELGLVLGLIKFESSPRRKGFSLLWLFDISW